MTVFQKNRAGSLESDSQLEMLERLERLCIRLSLAPKMDVDQRMVQAAREHFGEVFARGCEVFWQWPQLFDRRQDAFCLDSPDRFWSVLDLYRQGKINDVPLFGENQGCWEVIYRPMIDAVLLDDGDTHVLCSENLAGFFVSFALVDIGIHFSKHCIRGWLPQEMLDDDAQWELLWHRPSFISSQPLYYLHRTHNILVWSSGAHITTRMTTKSNLLLDEMAELMCAPPNLNESVPPRRTIEMFPHWQPTQHPLPPGVFNQAFDDDDIPF